jgi:4'-phosphopantetheinyl transferase
MSAATGWTPGPASPRLGRDDVHVWLADLDRRPVHSSLAVLADDERARAARFHFEHDRVRFAAARALLRELLAGYLSLRPEVVRFAYGPRGKPALCGAAGAAVRFNVSHSGGLALLAFARGRELGIDLELERPVPESGQIAERFFSAWEASELRRCPEDERPAAFFRCWTRKEAYIKATGDGLSRALDSFDVTLGASAAARLLHVEGAPGEVERWWLQGLEPAPGFAAALAVEGRPSRVACWRLDERKEVIRGREGRQDGLQGGRQPRGAVLDLAG